MSAFVYCKVRFYGFSRPFLAHRDLAYCSYIYNVDIRTVRKNSPPSVPFKLSWSSEFIGPSRVAKDGGGVPVWIRYMHTSTNFFHFYERHTEVQPQNALFDFRAFLLLIPLSNGWTDISFL